VQALRYREVNAYTDLLLHDMGPELADICFGLAAPSEFRTEPLMGLRFSEDIEEGTARFTTAGRSRSTRRFLSRAKADVARSFAGSRPTETRSRSSQVAVSTAQRFFRQTPTLSGRIHSGPLRWFGFAPSWRGLVRWTFCRRCGCETG
jgi:hypothetical protein